MRTPPDSHLALAGHALADQALAIRDIRTTSALAELGPEWRALWERCPGATPFQSHEWLLPWWRHFGNEALWVITLRRAGRLVGVAPFYIYSDAACGIRQVTLVGNGISDHLDVLLDPDVGSDGARAIMSHLGDRCASWISCDFRDLSAGSTLLTAEAPRGAADETVDEDPCPTIALPHSAEDLSAAVPAGVLHKLRYYRRRAEQLGEVRFACVSETANHDALQRAFDVLLELHRARWATREEPGVLDEAEVVAFHREVIGGFLVRGWLRLYTMHIGEHIAAAYYGFVAKRRAYAYLGGFDPAFRAVAPGRLILLHAMTGAVQEGAREFDFLRGREPYKYVWGAADRPQYRRRLWLTRADCARLS